jgi:uncharacterized protein (TIGR03089 family)
VSHFIAEALRSRVRSGGGAPLLTYYDLATGERTELSATTFANWVDKTSNLATDELWVEPGDRVALRLARTAPGHWVTAVWEVACWQVGAVVDVTASSGAGVVIAGPDVVEAQNGSQTVVACSLHPFATGLGRLPVGVTDYDLAVRAHPDSYLAVAQPATAPAWVDESGTLTQADLLGAVVDRSPRRRLVRPSSPWITARDGLITALVSGGSAVVVVGEDQEALGRIQTMERVA